MQQITNTVQVRARFVNYTKGCTQLAVASDKVYQLLAHDRCFSSGTPASSTTKTGCHDIAEILLKVALKHQKSINQYHYILIMCSYVSLYYTVLSHFMNFCVIFHTFHFCTNYKTIHMSLASSCIYRPSSGFWSKNFFFLLGTNFLKNRVYKGKFNNLQANNRDISLYFNPFLYLEYYMKCTPILTNTI